MTVRELIEILQRYEQDARVIIAESEYTWDDVLIVLEESPNQPEIHL